MARTGRPVVVLLSSGRPVDVRGIECKPGDRVIVPINPLHVKGMKIQYR